MSKVIAIINQKGGVGKSTTASAIGAGLLLRGLRVLFVDLDAQGNLSYSLGADATGLTGLSSLDVLEGRAEALKAVPGKETLSPALRRLREPTRY